MTKILSVVSITKNDVPGIERTIKSITGHSLHAVEVIVVAPEGDPVFGSDVVRNSALEICLLKQSGRGIYNAMNDGLDNAIANYVTFLNGGDEFFDLDRSLAKITSEYGNDVFLFDTVEQDDQEFRGTNWYYKAARSAAAIQYAMPTHHQSIVYKTELAKGIKYDESYQYAGDYDFTARVLKKAERNSIVKEPFSIFHLGGISQQVSRHMMFGEINRVKSNALEQNRIKRNLFRIKHFFLHQLRFRLSGLYKKLRYNSAICRSCLGNLKKEARGIHVCNQCQIGYSEFTQRVNYQDETHQLEADTRWQEFAKRDVKLIKSLIPDDILKNKHILEIGSGSGALLRELSEFGCTSLSFCEANIDLADKLKDEGFNQALAPNECLQVENLLNLMKEFDLIIFNHVVEHFDNPVAFLKATDDEVDADLLFFQTDYTSNLARILGKFWPGLQLTQHRAHFSTSAFKQIFRRHTIRLQPYWLDYKPREKNTKSFIKYVIKNCIRYKMFKKEDAFVIHLTKDKTIEI